MNRIIVTGGSGFIGTNLLQALEAEGHQLLSLDVRDPACAEHRPLWRRLDINDRDGLVTTFRDFQPEYVYHLAARTDMHGASTEDYAANTTGVSNLIAAAQATADCLRRVVFASSRMVCPIGYQPLSPTDWQPPNPYGASKVRGEQLVRESALACEWLLVRPTSIWGPWFGVPYRDFFDAVRRGRYVHPRGTHIRKSFGYIGNTVFQLQRLMQAPATAVQGRMFYLADYEPIEVRAWGEMIRQAFGAPPIRDVPQPLLRVLAKTGDGLCALGWKNVPLTSFRLNNLLTQMLHDTTALASVCGPLPHRLDEAVERTVSWMQDGR